MEVWRDITGYETLYQISNRGRVKSMLRAGRILKPYLNNKGYAMVKLCNCGKTEAISVHRLVASAFCNKPKGCNIVNHLDNTPLNNNAENLEWTTYKGNSQHALKQGRLRGGLCNYRPVVGISGDEIRFYTYLNLTKKDGFEPSCVSNCCAGKRKTHKGFAWRYATEQEVKAKERSV